MPRRALVEIHGEDPMAVRDLVARAFPESRVQLAAPPDRPDKEVWAVVLAGAASTRQCLEDARRLRASTPSAPVCVALAPAAASLETAFLLGQLSIDACWARDRTETVSRVRGLIHTASIQRRVREVSESLFAALPDVPKPLVQSACAGIVSPFEEDRRATDASRPLLTAWLRRASLPPPRRFLAWCRLLIAGRLLEDPTRSIEGVALELGYATGVALHRGCRSLAGLPVKRVRSDGWRSTLLVAMLHEFADSRRAARPRQSEQAEMSTMLVGR